MFLQLKANKQNGLIARASKERNTEVRQREKGFVRFVLFCMRPCLERETELGGGGRNYTTDIDTKKEKLLGGDTQRVQPTLLRLVCVVKSCLAQTYDNGERDKENTKNLNKSIRRASHRFFFR
jgi:hypothetical protein